MTFATPSASYAVREFTRMRSFAGLMWLSVSTPPSGAASRASAEDAHGGASV